MFWGALVPLLIVFGGLVHPASLGGILIYPIQISRIAFGQSATVPRSWTYAMFIMLAKVPELQGILKFFCSRLRGHAIELIEYK
jgi:hypothetical protein